ncbi:MAG: AmmeMemoRadiSam system radical SAM enzyme [Bacteroidales bacterium]|jgi:pyruvate formate lyase activating enzyme|nr:AmmeMemoRadiSam system radical SAM enzyme [Bacteroidales bacterium]
MGIENFHNTLFCRKISSQKVKCTLCPHNCIIVNKKYGVCGVRYNYNGELVSENYGQISSMGFDPIEKKPLYHFYPGKQILSIGSIGCNLKCFYCQNWQISLSNFQELKSNLILLNPSDVLDKALSKSNNIGVAYTYNEPVVFYEFMLDTAKLIKANGLKNVMVTNGYINKAPLLELLNYIDAFNVDLKAFNDEFYKKSTSSTLQPVLDTIKIIKEHGKHLEITNLVIPSLNDDSIEFENMVKWIANEIGENTVLHLSAYYPNYNSDIELTSISLIMSFFKIAKKYLKNVYVGNVIIPEGNNTYCEKCGNLLISRSGYIVDNSGLNKDGTCKKCGNRMF